MGASQGILDNDGHGEGGPMDLSIIIPIYNEEDCILPLEEELSSVVEVMPGETEVLFVDDGSDDRTPELLASVVGRHEWAKVIRLKRNFGQTRAMAVGFDQAKGELFACMDGDLQNDPEDIPRLIEKMDQGYDIVSGWRRTRYDAFVTRRLPSMCANWLIGRFLRVKIHDYGCSLKVYNARVMRSLNLYSDMHRFLPALASKCGARVTELPVNHRPRIHGKSKYGLSRIFKVVADLLVIKLIVDFSNRPAHAFGMVATWLILLCVMILPLWIYNLVVQYRDNIVLPSILILLGLCSLYFFILGVLGDMIVRVRRHDATDSARSTAIEIG